MIPEEFSKFIAERLKTRETKVIKKKEMEVKALPEFVKFFKDSKFISCVLELWINLFYLDEKGKSHMLIRSIKKRSRDEFEAVQEKIEKEIWDAEREKMVMQIHSLWFVHHERAFRPWSLFFHIYYPFNLLIYYIKIINLSICNYI